MNPGFDFYVGGIEDAILAALRAGMQGVKTFDTYSGELDNQNLREAIGAKSPTFPLILASYADGVDVPMPKTAPVLGRSLHFRHDCSFAVICASNDPRGDEKRRRGPQGTYALMEKVRELLTGLRFKKVIDSTDVLLYGDALNEGDVILLTTEVLTPVANEFVAKMPNITAYAVIFETAFQWSSADRSTAGTAVSEFVLDVDSLNAESQTGGGLPGVVFES